MSQNLFEGFEKKTNSENKNFFRVEKLIKRKVDRLWSSGKVMKIPLISG